MEPNRKGVSMALVIEFAHLPQSGSDTRVFNGAEHGANVSFFLIDLLPGDGPPLHKHPYEEVFVIREGIATFTVGDSTIEAQAGRIVVAPADIPHAFVNSGTERLRSINIHPRPTMATEWIDG
jgi:quercetin dioxygenase-like cupin family protein